MAFSSYTVTAGTSPVLLVEPYSSEVLLVQVQGAGTAVLGGSTTAGGLTAGIQVTASSGIVSVPVQSFGGAADQDDGLYVHSTGATNVTVGVIQPL